MPIDFSNVFYSYNPKTPLEAKALNGVDLHIDDGDFAAIIGRTGCGKSTLIQHINALLIPSKGLVKVDEYVNSSNKKERSKKKKMPALRHHVGLVFQFPEYQLFEDTVEKDVAFGPKNFGYKKEEALEEAHKALQLVGLDESFYKRSPFELSGGEKRKVALAGILAFKPHILIVDEPTAGLDPMGAKAVMDLLEKIHQNGTTVILVTHDMDLVIGYANKAIIMEDGKIARIEKPSKLFKEDLDAYSLDTPSTFAFAKRLQAKGLHLDLEEINDVDELAKSIISKRNER